MRASYGEVAKETLPLVPAPAPTPTPGAALVTLEEQQAARRQELLRRKTLTIQEDRELQGLLYKYREELQRRHSLEQAEAVDLQWITEHPPEVRLETARTASAGTWGPPPLVGAAPSCPGS